MATKAIRKVVKKPISVKLSPNVPNIGLIAKQAEAAGADAITAVNTMGPGMLIDINMRCPVLANKVGGISGQALKPIAVRCVWDIYKAVKIPIPHRIEGFTDSSRSIIHHTNKRVITRLS